MYSKFRKTLYYVVPLLLVLYVTSFCNKKYTAQEEVLSVSYEKDLQELALFINTRLSYMKDVAAYKWEESGESPSEFRDLQEVVRPELIRLGDEIIQNVRIADLEEHPNSIVKSKKKIFIELISTEGLSTKNKEELFEAVTSIIILGK